MAIKITHQEYLESIKDTNYLCLGEYDTTRTKTPHLCMNCSHVWEAMPDKIKRGYRGCPECGGSRRKTTLEYQRDIQESSILFLGEYHRAHDRGIHLCMNCSHVWNPKCYSVANGSGCPRCNKRKSDYDTYKNKETTLYLVDISGKWVKPGISMSGIKGRFYGKAIKLNESVTPIKEIVYSDGWDAYLTEEWILENTDSHQAFFSNEDHETPLFGGNTEIRDGKIRNKMIEMFDKIIKERDE